MSQLPLTDLKRHEVLVLRDSELSALTSAARAAYPNEGCGVLIGCIREAVPNVREVTVARNLNSDRAHDRYELHPEDFIAADRSARSQQLDVIGFWHSHPDHPARPSPTDLEAAWPGYSYVIVRTTAGGSGPVSAWRLGDQGFYQQKIEKENR